MQLVLSDNFAQIVSPFPDFSLQISFSSLIGQDLPRHKLRFATEKLLIGGNISHKLLFHVQVGSILGLFLEFIELSYSIVFEDTAKGTDI